MLRLIAFDLDGTLLDSRGTLPARNRAALLAASRKVEIVLVSGRHHLSLERLHAEIGLPSPAICCNGGYVYDYVAKDILLPTPLAVDAARELAGLCVAAGLPFLVYCAKGMFCERRNPTATSEEGQYFLAGNAGLVTTVDDVDTLLRTEQAFKFVIAAEDAPPLRALQSRLSPSSFSAVFSWYNRLDVAAPTASKGGKLVDWAALRHIDASEIAAFGDQENDMSMLRAAGWGVAMGNATEDVKAIASLAIGDNDSSALADTVADLVARFA